MVKATMTTRKEIIARSRNKYKRSKKKGKGAILDSICIATGLSRSRAKHLLSGNGNKTVNKLGKRGRKPKYDSLTADALKRIWAYMGFPCGQHLVVGMDDMLGALVRFKEVDVDDDTLRKLKEMSPSTADRLLKHPREQMRFKGKSTTKPGTLLKRNIPIRLGTEWNDAVPGYVEIDLVAHCGDTTSGDYISTLDVTDICTGWTETQAAFNKAQKHVFGALLCAEERLPFPLLGIDSDNGSEFINDHLYRYCLGKGICFTRSRPYQKNDSCHVEQKNWHIIRRNIGYDRYEGRWALDAMNEYYALLRLYTNFFLPQTKLIEKHRDGSHIRKRYEKPKTPYRRALQSDNVTNEAKEKLNELYVTLNPAELKRGMMHLLKKLMLLRMPPLTSK